MTDLDFQEEEIEKLIKDDYPEFRFESDNIEINENDKIISIKKLTTENGISTNVDILSEYVKKEYFKKIVNDDTFYHFIRLEHALTIIKDKKIRLYNLNKYIENDPKEFFYFIEKMGIELPNLKDQIKQVKENVFVFSCTSDFKEKKQWKRFGTAANVVCLKLKINYTDKKNNAIKFWNVAYEKDLTKIFSLQTEISKKLDIQGWSYFAKFMKRDKLDWEKEIRLCFDKIEQEIANRFGMQASHQNIYFDDGNAYIEMPLKNDYFELCIEEVIIKKDSWQSQMKSLCSSKHLKFNLIS